MAVIFNAQDSSRHFQAWITNGTSEGTLLLKDFVFAGGWINTFTTVGGRAVITLSGGGDGASLWATDGTQTGTVLLKDSGLGSNVNILRNAPAGNGIVFAGAGGNFGTELWSTDGTVAGTKLVMDFSQFAKNSILGFQKAGDKALFAVSSAGDPVDGDFWITDGTIGGTVRLDSMKGLIPGAWSFINDPLTVVNNQIILPKSSAAGGQLVGLDIMTGTLNVIRDFTGSQPLYPTTVAQLGDKAIFNLRSTTGDFSEIWVSDSSEGGSIAIADLGAGRSVQSFKAIQGSTKLAILTHEPNGHRGIGFTDGTAGGTKIVADLGPMAISSFEPFTAVGDKIFFAVSDNGGPAKLWVSDGTAGGTHALTNLNVYNFPTYGDPVFNKVGDKLVFAASDATNGVELWVTDGTAQGTHMLRNINKTGDSNPVFKFAIGDKVYFDADWGGETHRLWVTDGTAAGTTILKNIDPFMAGRVFPVEINMAPSDVSLSANTIGENEKTGTVVSKLAATDFDLSDTHTYTLLDDAGGRFALKGDQIVVADRTLLDFEQFAAHTIVVRAVDQGGLSVDKTLTIVLNDIANEVVGGDARNNFFMGGAGQDYLNGWAGDDTLAGGGGDDKYVLDSVHDVVLETDANVATGGLDRVFSSVSHTLSANVEILRLTGSSAINGFGNGISNTILGNGANNILDGRGGNDGLAGGAGKDTFAFTSALNAATNVDVIADFSAADDMIWLRASGPGPFTALLKGALGAAAFYAEAGATSAHDADDRIIYNTTDGSLYYDTDGAGGADAIRFAILKGAPAVTAADFLIG